MRIVVRSTRKYDAKLGCGSARECIPEWAMGLCLLAQTKCQDNKEAGWKCREIQRLRFVSKDDDPALDGAAEESD
jgi:hypothetical protein